MEDVAENTAPSTLPLEELYALAGVARRWAEHGRVEDAQSILEGLAAFEAALERDPGDVAALTHAGELNLERGERARGLELLGTAAEQDPEETNPHANRARTLRALTAADVEA